MSTGTSCHFGHLLQVSKNLFEVWRATVKLTHGVARTFQLRVWIIFYICITDYIVKYGELSACSERTKEIHVVSALYSNDTPIQDCDHPSMRG